MTLRPARRRRYALSQYATVRVFSLAARMVWFLFPRRRRHPTNASISRRFGSRLHYLLGGSARMDIRMSRAIASFIQILPSIGSVYIQCKENRASGPLDPTDPPAVTAFPSSFRT